MSTVFKPCCEEARAVYDCHRCGHREYRDARLYAGFVTCENQPCGETLRAKRHPVLYPGETYEYLQPSFAHLVGFSCLVHGWTVREERQPTLFPSP